MSLYGKLEGDTEIKTPAHLFHDAYAAKPHHFSTITPDRVHNCELHEGEFGKEGSLVTFDYTHDGEKKSNKWILEKMDDKNLITTYKVLEGDLMKEHKSFKITFQVIPKESGSLARWTLEYEKNDENSPEQHSLLELLNQFVKDIDAHLIKTQS